MTSKWPLYKVYLIKITLLIKAVNKTIYNKLINLTGLHHGPISPCFTPIVNSSSDPAHKEHPCLAQSWAYCSSPDNVTSLLHLGFFPTPPPWATTCNTWFRGSCSGVWKNPLWMVHHNVTIVADLVLGSRDSSVVRALDLWSKGHGFKSLQEQL